MLGLLAVILTVILTALVAIATWKTASETKRMVQASVILQVRQQFDELAALDKKKVPKPFDLEAPTVMDKNSNEADIYKEMIIKYYKAFYNVMCFIKTKTIDKRIIHKIIFPLELKAFLKIIKPLEDELKVLTEHSAFDFWENYAKQHVRD